MESTRPTSPIVCSNKRDRPVSSIITMPLSQYMRLQTQNEGNNEILSMEATNGLFIGGANGKDSLANCQTRSNVANAGINISENRLSNLPDLNLENDNDNQPTAQSYIRDAYQLNRTVIGQQNAPQNAINIINNLPINPLSSAQVHCDEGIQSNSVARQVPVRSTTDNRDTRVFVNDESELELLPKKVTYSPVWKYFDRVKFKADLNLNLPPFIRCNFVKNGKNVTSCTRASRQAI